MKGDLSCAILFIYANVIETSIYENFEDLEERDYWFQDKEITDFKIQKLMFFFNRLL